MARIAGVDLPNKHVDVALTYIFGIGPSSARRICAATGIDPQKPKRQAAIPPKQDLTLVLKCWRKVLLPH